MAHHIVEPWDTGLSSCKLEACILIGRQMADMNGLYTVFVWPIM